MGRLSLALLVLLAAPATAWAETPAAAPQQAAGGAASDHAPGADAAAGAAQQARPADKTKGKSADDAKPADKAKGKSADDAKPADKNDEGASDANATQGDAASPTDASQKLSDDSKGSSGASGPKSQPPSYYYVDPSTPPTGKRPAAATPAEPPPPPGYGPDLIYEPPPPPKPHHVAPKTSLWLGARAGWFVPFGSLWGTCTQVVAGQCQLYQGTKWSAYASSGPMFEVDAGARLSRNYNLFALWEHASLGTGSAEPDAHGGQKNGSTDYYALGARISSDPDSVGFLTEVDIGYRRFHALWADGSELQLTNAPFEFRIGVGADIRVSRGFSLSPMATVGAGGFGTVKRINSSGAKEAINPPADETAGHAWATLQIGGHFDIAGSKD